MAIISASTTITFRTWNVRTRFEAGETAQVAAEMRNYNLTVLRLRKTRWTGSDQWKLATGELLLYSGHGEDNAPHTHGAALMLSKTAQRALTGWAMGGTWTKDYQGHLPDKEREDQHGCHPVLCSYK